jgi:hypothetical protein
VQRSTEPLRSSRSANRDATSPRTIAEERGYDEIVAMMVAQEEKRGARGANAFGYSARS